MWILLHFPTVNNEQWSPRYYAYPPQLALPSSPCWRTTWTCWEGQICPLPLTKDFELFDPILIKQTQFDGSWQSISGRNINSFLDQNLYGEMGKNVKASWFWNYPARTFSDPIRPVLGLQAYCNTYAVLTYRNSPKTCAHQQEIKSKYRKQFSEELTYKTEIISDTFRVLSHFFFQMVLYDDKFSRN